MPAECALATVLLSKPYTASATPPSLRVRIRRFSMALPSPIFKMTTLASLADSNAVIVPFGKSYESCTAKRTSVAAKAACTQTASTPANTVFKRISNILLIKKPIPRRPIGTENRFEGAFAPNRPSFLRQYYLQQVHGYYLSRYFSSTPTKTSGYSGTIVRVLQNLIAIENNPMKIFPKNLRTGV